MCGLNIKYYLNQSQFISNKIRIASFTECKVILLVFMFQIMILTVGIFILIFYNIGLDYYI